MKNPIAVNRKSENNTIQRNQMIKKAPIKRKQTANRGPTPIFFDKVEQRAVLVRKLQHLDEVNLSDFKIL